MELLEDVRFLFELNDKQKGLYLLMLALAGKTGNRIPDNVQFIKGRLNLEELHKSDLEKISQVYSGFALKGGFWSFEKFNETHNFIHGKSQGTPKEIPGNSPGCSKRREEKNRKDNNTKLFVSPTIEEIQTYMQEIGVVGPKDEAFAFQAHHAARGWKLKGGFKIEDWRAACRTWKSNQTKFSGVSNGNGTQPTRASRPFPKDS